MKDILEKMAEAAFTVSELLASTGPQELGFSVLDKVLLIHDRLLVAFKAKSFAIPLLDDPGGCSRRAPTNFNICSLRLPNANLSRHANLLGSLAAYTFLDPDVSEVTMVRGAQSGGVLSYVINRS